MQQHAPKNAPPPPSAGNASLRWFDGEGTPRGTRTDAEALGALEQAWKSERSPIASPPRWYLSGDDGRGFRALAVLDVLGVSHRFRSAPLATERQAKADAARRVLWYVKHTGFEDAFDDNAPAHPDIAGWLPDVPGGWLAMHRHFNPIEAEAMNQMSKFTNTGYRQAGDDSPPIANGVHSESSPNESPPHDETFLASKPAQRKKKNKISEGWLPKQDFVGEVLAQHAPSEEAPAREDFAGEVPLCDVPEHEDPVVGGLASETTPSAPTREALAHEVPAHEEVKRVGQLAATEVQYQVSEAEAAKAEPELVAGTGELAADEPPCPHTPGTGGPADACDAADADSGTAENHASSAELDSSTTVDSKASELLATLVASPAPLKKLLPPPAPPNRRYPTPPPPPAVKGQEDVVLVVNDENINENIKGRMLLVRARSIVRPTPTPPRPPPRLPQPETEDDTWWEHEDGASWDEEDGWSSGYAHSKNDMWKWKPVAPKGKGSASTAAEQKASSPKKDVHSWKEKDAYTWKEKETAADQLKELVTED